MTGLAILAVTGFSIAVTVGAYTLSLWARKRYPSPVTTPVLFSTVIIIATLLASGISFADYKPPKDIMVHHARESGSGQRRTSFRHEHERRSLAFALMASQCPQGCWACRS